MQFKQVENPRGSTVVVDGQPFVLLHCLLVQSRNYCRHFNHSSQMMLAL